MSLFVSNDAQIICQRLEFFSSVLEVCTGLWFQDVNTCCSSAGQWRIQRGGGELEQLPPSQRKLSLVSPFLARSAPLVVTLRHSFNCLDQNMGQTCKSRSYLVEKPMNLLNQKSIKIFARLRPPLFQLYFWCPFCRLPLPQLRAGSALAAGRVKSLMCKVIIRRHKYSISIPKGQNLDIFETRFFSHIKH